MCIHILNRGALFICLALVLLGCKADSPRDSNEGCVLEGVELCECDGGVKGQKACDISDEVICVCKDPATTETNTQDTDTEEEPVWRDDGGSLPVTDTGEDIDAGSEQKEVCVEQSTEARPGIGKAVDIIFVIDNSGSMNAEIAAVEDNINSNFADIISASGVDYRVIMLSIAAASGSFTAPVCIGPPLSGASCTGAAEPTNGERFFHYDIGVYSNDAWCIMLSTFNQPDVHGLAPSGWSEWLRPDANKAFVIITDDRARCTYEPWQFGSSYPPDTVPSPSRDAVEFDKALRRLSPEQFGTTQDRSYIWHSIVGMASKQNDSGDPLPMYYSDPIEEQRCTANNGASGVAPGEAYQYLSTVTRGLRYSVCEGEGDGFDDVFRALAFGVIAASKAECTFEIPEAPEGQVIDRDTVNVEYIADQSGAQQFGQVVGLNDCDANSFYIIDDKIELCPDACKKVEEDDHAKVNVLFSCDPDAPPPPLEPDAGDPDVQK